MTKTLLLRIKNKIDNTSNWKNSDMILEDGELGIEKLKNGIKKIKIGNGENIWNELEYFGGSIENIVDGVENGSIRSSTSFPEDDEYSLGKSAVAEGLNTKASGNNSHAEGAMTIASGAQSHSEGYNTKAIGSCSHASGENTIAKGENQTVLGKNNIQDDNNEFAFIIGNGSETTPSNAMTVNWNGEVKAAGKKLATEEYVGINGGKIDTIKVNNENLTITDKSVNIEIPTKVSELDNDESYIKSSETYNKTEIDTKFSNKISQISAQDKSVEVGTDENGVTIKVRVSNEDENALQLTENGLKVTIPEVNIPEQTDYSINITESSSEGFVKAYTITQPGTGVSATINIPKDMVVRSGTVEKKETSGVWGLAGTYLILTLANATEDKVYIDVSTLIKYVTSGSSVDDSIQIMVSTDHKITATIKDKGITIDKLDDAIITSLNKVNNKVEKTGDIITGGLTFKTSNYLDYQGIAIKPISENGFKKNRLRIEPNYDGVDEEKLISGGTVEFKDINILIGATNTNDNNTYNNIINISTNGNDKTFAISSLGLTNSASITICDNRFEIMGLTEPQYDTSAANKKYVDEKFASIPVVNTSDFVHKTGDNMTGDLSFNLGKGISLLDSNNNSIVKMYGVDNGKGDLHLYLSGYNSIYNETYRFLDIGCSYGIPHFSFCDAQGQNIFNMNFSTDGVILSGLSLDMNTTDNTRAVPKKYVDDLMKVDIATEV